MKTLVSKLTLTQAKIIAIVATLLVSILSTTLIVFSIETHTLASSEDLVLSILVYVSWFLFVYILTYVLIAFCLFDLPEKDSKEKVMENYSLTKNEYIQVYYNSTTAPKSHRPFLWLIQSKYYFYAKLSENEDLHLLVKTESQDVKYNDTVSFQYFNAHFKKTKEQK